ncbi:MAG TPA: ATP-binding protein, partial [Salinisphaeraceae bacterium]|nr:ATP-binding protein [Salinisphaeraceae bacterium]
TVLQIHGNPLPGGGFVTTYNDITVFKRTEAALKQVNEELEVRVSERTAALRDANAELRIENDQRALAQRQAHEARREAERANLSKTRFLAAASHDLLQPLNAARLFAAAPPEQDAAQMQRALNNIQSSLGAAQALLNPLLDISKIDAGSWDVRLETFPISQVLAPLAAEFQALAHERGLDFACLPSSCWVHSDASLLRRILQNFLANAVRYTAAGRVRIGCRRRPETLEIQVWDSGPGIAADQIEHVFEEFQRGDNIQDNDQGLGLGLSLADRMARMLGHAIRVQSEPGRGTMFSLEVARRAPRPAPPSLPQQRVEPEPVLAGLQLLCVDDDAASLAALDELLQRWQIQVSARLLFDPQEANLAAAAFDAALIDYNLGDNHATGLEVIEQLLQQGVPACVLITANRDRAIRQQARALGVSILYKPVAPAKLRAVLSHIEARLPRRKMRA